MDEQVPQQLKTAAIVQLVSGLLNVFMVAYMSGFAISMVLGCCTGGFGGICGVWSCALIPVGIFEIVAGVMGLTNPKAGGPIMKYAAVAEMGSVLFGGIPSAIAGFLVYQWLNEPEVVAYIESDIIDV